MGGYCSERDKREKKEIEKPSENNKEREDEHKETWLEKNFVKEIKSGEKVAGTYY
jgi:hypothetical protein